ncbi:Protein arginine N-methyltransferase 3 [Asimina triloba]
MARFSSASMDEEEEDEQIEDWDDWKTDEEEPDNDLMCLFCDLKFASVDSLFDHCRSFHAFDFEAIRKGLQLDFYGSFKLINYIRSQVNYKEVAVNKCWSCDSTFQSNKDLQNHLHIAVTFGRDSKLPWLDDSYLKPFMPDDSLLHNFGDDEDGEEDFSASIDREELLRELGSSDNLGEINIDDEEILDNVPSELAASNENNRTEASCVPNGSLNSIYPLEKAPENGVTPKEDLRLPAIKHKNENLKISLAYVASREIKNTNESYFGAYGSFGIHREMISDKVRTGAYRDAILNNPSLMNHAVVMDVGCGTGILSLFAAQAGASRVIAVEASEKMAAVATQIAKDNGLLQSGNCGGEKMDGVITVVQCMVEDLNKSIQIPPNSVDVLVSEWMGYCLLYESMLSSVLFARDHWLKPDGAILPDSATMFVAGFGKGGTSIPFWENVYGFDMSCIGKEVSEDAARTPIIDVIDSHDIVTDSIVLQDVKQVLWYDTCQLCIMSVPLQVVILLCQVKLAVDVHNMVHLMSKLAELLFLFLSVMMRGGLHGMIVLKLACCQYTTFDLVTMKSDDADFTVAVELEPKLDLLGNSKDAKSGAARCYGVVLWFETAFSDRFCNEMSTNLSTSPYSPKTHWSQTILTFGEPIAMGSTEAAPNRDAAIGTDLCPVARIALRISIARSVRHRSIDISLETAGICLDGRKRSWPVQIFNI